MACGYWALVFFVPFLVILEGLNYKDIVTCTTPFEQFYPMITALGAALALGVYNGM